MNITLISGSMKADGGQSTRIAGIIAAQLEADNHTTHHIEARQIPNWDESMWGIEAKENQNPAAKIWAPLSEKLQKSDALIILAPEYNGTVPAALKNFFHCLSAKEAAHKATLLISVSASETNGSYPIAELRATASKNNKLVFIPDHLIIRNAEKVFTPDHDNTYISDRLTYSLKMLTHYAEALKPLQTQEIPNSYKFGM